jgi:hypothetical protein
MMILRSASPSLSHVSLAHEKRVHLVFVAGQRDVLLNLVQLRGLDIDERILLPIDNALRQSDVEFRELDLLRFCTQCLHDVDRHRVRWRSNLHALQVGWRLDRLLVVRDMANAIVPVT